MSDLTSGAIFIVFTVLLLVGAISTASRWLRYHRFRMRAPVLLSRDRDLLIGLAIPFLIIAAVRAFGLREYTLAADGDPHLWYLLLTGLPPIYAMARFVFFELFVIEKVVRIIETDLPPDGV